MQTHPIIVILSLHSTNETIGNLKTDNFKIYIKFWRFFHVTITLHR